jgi:site-specific DNA-methyltransferase (adenine-specific)
MINLIKGDCLEKMQDIESGSVDMVLTSPPYDNLRDYGKEFTGWGDYIWMPCLDQIYRTLKDGGVCVWIVADATIKGSETGTSFKQAQEQVLSKPYMQKK